MEATVVLKPMHVMQLTRLVPNLMVTQCRVIGMLACLMMNSLTRDQF